MFTSDQERAQAYWHANLRIVSRLLKLTDETPYRLM